MRARHFMAITMLIVLAGCSNNHKDSADGDLPSAPTSTLAATPIAPQPSRATDYGNRTYAYSGPDVVSSITIAKGGSWTGDTPVLPGAQRGIGYELIDCDPSVSTINNVAIIAERVDGTRERIGTSIEEPRGYIPLTDPGTKADGKVYNIFAAPSFPCKARLDFVSKPGTENQTLIQSASRKLGLEDRVTIVQLPPSWTFVWSVKCYYNNVRFRITEVDSGKTLVQSLLPSKDRFHGSFTGKGSIGSAVAVENDNCEWYFNIYA